MNIKDKVIIVTGASMGIGLSAAKLLSEKGATVVLAARSEDVIKKLEQEIPHSYAVTTDMTNPDSIKNLIDTVFKKYGKIDVLVNNAGQGMQGDIEHMDPENYRKILDLNVIGPVIALQTVAPIMRKQGGGMIVNISSMVSKMYLPYLGAYSSTKFALNSLMLTARQELAKDKIIVSMMHPGLTSTDFGKNALKPKTAHTAKWQRPEHMPQADTPEQVAEKIVEGTIRQSSRET